MLLPSPRGQDRVRVLTLHTAPRPDASTLAPTQLTAVVAAMSAQVVRLARAGSVSAHRSELSARGHVPTLAPTQTAVAPATTGARQPHPASTASASAPLEGLRAAPSAAQAPPFSAQRFAALQAKTPQ